MLPDPSKFAVKLVIVNDLNMTKATMSSVRVKEAGYKYTMHTVMILQLNENTALLIKSQYKYTIQS